MTQGSLWQYAVQMEALCSRTDLLGLVGRFYLSCPASAAERRHNSPATARAIAIPRRPRLSLRTLASYRTLLSITLLYLLGALFSFGLLSSTGLLLVAAAVYGLFMSVLSDKLKTH